MNNTLKELEMKLLFYRKEDFEVLLAKDYKEIGVSGIVYNKTMEMNYVNSHQALLKPNLIISNFFSKEISENIVMNSFTTTDKMENIVALRTSLWRKQFSNDWVIFSPRYID